jgi:hypothetical protein
MYLLFTHSFFDICTMPLLSAALAQNEQCESLYLALGLLNESLFTRYLNTWVTVRVTHRSLCWPGSQSMADTCSTVPCVTCHVGTMVKRRGMSMSMYL